MANSTHPLLSEYSNSEGENPKHSNPNLNVDIEDENEYVPIPSLDSTIETCIGDLGWPQLFQALLVSLAWLFDAQQTFLSIFTDADPPWHCTDSTTTSINSNCSSFSTDVCLLPSDSWAWDLPRHASFISEWGLQCAGSFLTGLPGSSFFMGCLIGGLVLATLADSSLGRKNMLFLGSLVMSLSALCTAFSSNVWIYSALRFVAGFGRSTIGTCSLVLSTELVGKRWRGQVGVIGFLCFTLGFLSLPALAFVNRGSSWRNLYLWTSIPAVLYCLIVRVLVRESPRWLFVKGRKDDAIATLKSMAPPSNLDNLSMMSFSRLPLEQETSSNVDIYSTIKILVQKTWAFRRLSTVMAIGFGIGLVYYGMPLSLGNLAFNLYLSVTFNALSEIPASLVTFLMIGRMNRKTGILVFTVVSGVCSVISVVNIAGKQYKWMQMGLELVSFFSACTAFNVLLIFTIELFPTCVRNFAISLVRQALVFGGVFSPLLAAAGRGGNELVSYGVFGLVIGCCGLFVICLPETRGRAISDTMDEEEHKATSGPLISSPNSVITNNNYVY
ncbi:organic cation/carnitine transporter 3 [Ziziphus jujuba]|uniref:Organic cation/carnitine transporter 3 n=2 Tax=Ziziphus jujuba TaxID=326968 RepID=A0ABM3IDA1_ZIZJJ|nr:organic cation/carnitine transporter 3 [Ziziphus jujuba]KAH7536663.1 hypothetical protein FEM48_Zijuj03G0008400 [Ziziphus jujuba var. spinosa]